MKKIFKKNIKMTEEMNQKIKEYAREEDTTIPAFYGKLLEIAITVYETDKNIY